MLKRGDHSTSIIDVINQEGQQNSRARRASAVSQSAQKHFLQQQKLQISQPSRRGSVAAQTIANYIRSSPHPLLTAAAVFVFHEHMLPLFTQPKHKRLAYEAMRELLFFVYEGTPPTSVQGLEPTSDYGNALRNVASRVSAIAPDNRNLYQRTEPMWRLCEVDTRGNTIDQQEFEQYVGVTNAAKFEFTRRFFVVSREVSTKKTQFMQKKAMLLSQAVIRIANQTVSRLFYAWRAHVVRTKVVKERYRNIFLAVSTTAFTKDAIRKWKNKAHGIVLKRDAMKMAQLQRVSSNVLMSLGIVKKETEGQDEALGEGTLRFDSTIGSSTFSSALGTSSIIPNHGTAAARAANAKKKLMRLKQASNALLELKQNKLRIIDQLRQGNDALLQSHKSLVKKEQRYLRGIARISSGWQTMLDMIYPDPRDVPYFPQLVDYSGFNHLLRESTNEFSHVESVRTSPAQNQPLDSPTQPKKERSSKQKAYEMDLLKAEMVPETPEERHRDMIMWLVRAAQLDDCTSGSKLESLLLRSDVHVALVSQVQHLMPILRPLLTVFMNTSGYGSLPNDNAPQVEELSHATTDSTEFTVPESISPVAGLSAQSSLQFIPSQSTLPPSAAPSLPSFSLMAVTNTESKDRFGRGDQATAPPTMASSFVIPEMIFEDISGKHSTASSPQKEASSPSAGGGGGLLTVPGAPGQGSGSLMAGRGTKRLLSARMNQIAAKVIMGNEPSSLTVVVPSSPTAMTTPTKAGTMVKQGGATHSNAPPPSPSSTARRGSLKNVGAVERAARSLEHETSKTSFQPFTQQPNNLAISNSFFADVNPMKIALASKLLKPFGECVDKTDFAMLILEALNALVYAPLGGPLKALLMRWRSLPTANNVNSNSQSLSMSLSYNQNYRHLSASTGSISGGGRGGMSVSFGDANSKRAALSNNFTISTAIGHRFVPLEPNDPNAMFASCCQSSGEFSPNASMSRRTQTNTTPTLNFINPQQYFGTGLSFLNAVLPLSLCKYISANKSEDWRRLLISFIFYSQLGPTSGAFRTISTTKRKETKSSDYRKIPHHLSLTLNDSNSDSSPATSPRDSKRSTIPTATAVGIPVFDPLVMSSKVTKVGASIHKSNLSKNEILSKDIPSSGRDMRTFFADRITSRDDAGAATLAQSVSTTYYETAQQLVSSSLEVTGIVEEATSVYDMYSAASPDVYDSRIITQSFLATKFKVIFGKDSTFWRQIVNTRSMITSALEFQELLVTLAPGAGISPSALCQKMLAALDDVDLFYIATSSEAVQDAFAQHLTDLSVIFSLFAKGEPPNFVVDLQRWMHLSTPFFDIYYTPDLAEQIYKDTVKRFKNAGAMVVTNTIGSSGRTDYALQWRRPSAVTPIEGINNNSTYLIGGFPNGPSTTPSQNGRTPSDHPLNQPITPLAPALLQGGEKEKKRMHYLAPSHVLVPSAISLVDNDSPVHSRHERPFGTSFNSSINNSSVHNNNSSRGPSSSSAAAPSVDLHFHDPGLDLDGLCNALCSVASIKMPNPLIPLEQRIDKFITELLVPIVGSKVKDSRRREVPSY